MVPPSIWYSNFCWFWFAWGAREAEDLGKGAGGLGKDSETPGNETEESAKEARALANKSTTLAKEEGKDWKLLAKEPGVLENAAGGKEKQQIEWKTCAPNPVKIKMNNNKSF